MKLKKIAQLVALIGIASPAIAQTANAERVTITGSSIKRIQTEGALPIEIITRAQLDRDGIVTAEQLISTLNINGNGSDNLASNADVTSGAQRGNNGATSANLRGQGADSTLVLLNGRRIATHGMKGQAVDLNSIPMAAVERVEILKDGASAIYGTDAIGGVINFILRQNFTGLEGQAFTDMTEAGGGNIQRASLVGGFGNLDKDGFNVIASLGHSQNKSLKGDQRDFVNTFQPNRGLSVDTRGTPYATVFATTLADTILSKKSNTGPVQPGTTQAMSGINVLDLPGQAGCGSVPGMGAYDEVLWNSPAAKWGCAWDTGRAAVLQQPVENTNLVSRATFKLNQHQLFAEVVGSRVEVLKSFSANQVSPSASTFNAASFYPLNATTKSTYDSVFNSIAAVFPTIAGNYGLPIAYRWRCMPCDNREIATATDASRIQFGADGPIGNWDYRVGVSRASSESKSKLGGGYFYTTALANALGTGVINPFLPSGQQQTQAAMDLLQSASARGVTLYGGKTTLTQADASVSGEVFKMPAGPAMAAVGVDIRKEEYSFNGDERAVADQRAILNAPFDNQNGLNAVSRNISAVYAELLLPFTKQLDVTIAGRRDHYSGFGNTFNPKVSFRFTPTEQLLFRGSYNTGFRAPSFNQLFNLPTLTTYAGKDLADPATCPGLKVDSTKAGCSAITPVIVTGGKDTLGPETAKQAGLGFVWQPLKNFSTNVDLWEIRKRDTIQSINLTTLMANYGLFSSSFLRDGTGNLVAVDQRWLNAGDSVTRGIEIGAKLNGTLGTGKWVAALDGAYLIEKKSRPLASAPFGASEVGRFTFTGDLGLRWKHTAYFTYYEGPWSTTITQIYRGSYTDQVLPGVANGLVTPPDWNAKVDAYSIFNVSASYSGIKNLILTAGIKNLLNTDPPFAITYDSNTGAGSSWEPRVADPRGRSFTLMANYKFF